MLDDDDESLAQSGFGDYDHIPPIEIPDKHRRERNGSQLLQQRRLRYVQTESTGMGAIIDWLREPVDSLRRHAGMDSAVISI